MSVVLVAGAIASAPYLASCGVMASIDCAARARCDERDSGASPAQPDVDGNSVGVDPQTGETAPAAPTSSDGSASSSPPVDAGARTDAAHDGAGATSREAGPSNGGNDAAAGNPSKDAGVQDVAVDTGAVEPPSDAAVNDDVASSECDPNSCPPCVPYFLACCTPGGTCGCSLLFPPGPCN